MNEDPAKPARKRKVEPPARKAKGFLPAAALTPAALKSVGAKRGFVEARLLTDWRGIVGDALGALCRPVKVSYAGGSPGLGATLVVTAEGARAPEVEMRRPQIIERVNAFYGYRAVSRLRIDQSRSAMGFAEAQAPFEGAPPPTVTPAPGVEDEKLALALGRLGANIRLKAARKAARDRRVK